MEKIIIVALLYCVIGFLVVNRYRSLMYNNNLDLFDGLFFGGCIFIVFPIALTVFLGKITLGDFDKSYSFDLLNDISTTIYALSSVIAFGMVANFKPKCKTLYLSKQIPEYCKQYLLLTFVLYSISEIIFFIASGKASGDAHWYSSNAGTFEKGFVYVLLGQFHNVGRVIIPAIFIYLEIKSPSYKTLRLHLLFSVVLIFLELILSGNRIAMLFILLSFLLPFILLQRFKGILYLGLLSLPLLGVAQIWPQVRGLLWTQKLSVEHVNNVFSTVVESSRKTSLPLENPLLVATEGSNLITLNYTVKKYKNSSDLLLGETILLKSIGTFIPKSVWKGKPDALGLTVGQEISNISGLVLNATIIGEAWANFGIFGVPIIILLAYLIDLPISKLEYKSFFSSIMFMAGIASWRFDFSFFVIVILIMLLIHLMLQFYLVRVGASKCANFIFD